MSEPINYHELRHAPTPAHNARRNLVPDVRTARRKEQSLRAATARSRALGVLAKHYWDEYLPLYRIARAEVDAERGPLPGDEDAA